MYTRRRKHLYIFIKCRRAGAALGTRRRGRGLAEFAGHKIYVCTCKSYNTRVNEKYISLGMKINPV